MRLVLDTNVWVDWLVFDDPVIAPVKTAHRERRVDIVIDDACLRELNAVLAYPEFGLSDAQMRGHLVEIQRCTIRNEVRKPARSIPLPRCRDPDDQKFLVLASDAGADWLMTRDKALLKLHRRTEMAGFRVGSPSQWLAAYAVAVD